MTAPTPDLSPAHRAIIDASAIAPAVALARGYRTIPGGREGIAELLALGFAPKQARAPALLVPVWGVAGDAPVTHQIRPDAPRTEKKASGKVKVIKYETPAGARMALDVPRAARAQIDDPRVPLWITEGARKADAGVSHGLCCVALLGVWNWKGTNAKGGKTILADWGSVALNGREVFIAFDSDVMEKPEVERALSDLKDFLDSRDARVSLVYLPSAVGGAKVGLDDYFAGGGTVDALRELATKKLRKGSAQPPPPLAAPPPPSPSGEINHEPHGPHEHAHEPPAPPAKPTLHITHDISGMADALEAALVASKTVHMFQRSGELVEPSRDGMLAAAGAPPRGALVIRAVSVSRLSDIASREIAWTKSEGKKGDAKPARPDVDAVKALLARPPGRWRYLRGIVTAPSFRSDGSILSRPGYDGATGLLMVDTRTKFLPVAEAPSRADARAALASFHDLLHDFPFVEPSDRAAIVASILTVLARHAIDGPVPMVIVRAPEAGSGKSMLVDLVGRIVTGEGVERYTLSKEEESERKQLFAIARSAVPIALLDNVDKTFGSSALDGMLTSQRVSDRVMGTNDNTSTPFTTVMFVTGNNLEIKGDLGRRIMLAEIAPHCERPDERANFRHPRILEHVAGERAKLVAGALTILRGFHVAGRPRAPETKPVGSFEAWDDLVRQAVIWAGDADPIDSRQRLRELGSVDREVLKELLSAWQESIGAEHPVSIADLVKLANDRTEQIFRSAPTFVHERLRNALIPLNVSRKNNNVDPVSVGYYLRKNKDKIVDGLCVTRGGTTHNNVAQWVLRQDGVYGHDKQGVNPITPMTPRSPPDPFLTTGSSPVIGGDGGDKSVVDARVRAQARMRVCGAELPKHDPHDPQTTQAEGAPDQSAGVILGVIPGMPPGSPARPTPPAEIQF